jgi:hypothetical protein
MRMSTKERIAILAASGLSPSSIADMVDRSLQTVHRVLWEIRNPEKARAMRRLYDAKRYGTDDYQKKDTEYRRQRYHNDPDVRRRKIDASARCRAKKRMENA